MSSTVFQECLRSISQSEVVDMAQFWLGFACGVAAISAIGVWALTALHDCFAGSE